MKLVRSAVVGEIRRQRIRGPHQTTFVASKWSSALRESDFECPDHDALEKAGKIFHETMTGIRERSETLIPSSIDPRSALCRLVAYANLAGAEVLDLMTSSRGAPNRRMVDSSDFSSRQIELEDGRKDNADQLMMGLIDSCVYPIQKYLKIALPSIDAEVSHGEQVDWEQVIVNANHYCLAYNFSQKAIYQRTYLSSADNRWIVESQDRDDARLLAVSDFLGEERFTERIMAIQPQSKELPAKLRIAPLPKRYVTRLPFKKNYYSVKTLSRRFAGHFELPDSMTLAIATTSSSTAALLDHQIQDISPGTLRNLVQAWVLLSEIAERWLINQAKHEAKFLAAADALIIPTKALETLFTEAIPIEPSVAQAICKFLTFNGERHDDLWGRPLIPLGEELRAIFVPSLIIPNTGRVIDNWVEATEPVAQARGAHFEKRMRTDTATIAGQYAKQSDACLLDAIVLPNGEGEIDLLAVIGGIILVGELKCRKQPADPAERHYFRVSVRQAVNQATRAASYLDHHRQFLLDRFRQIVSPEMLSLLNTAQLLPVVITNQYYCSGIAFAGVPVFNAENLLSNLADDDFRKVLRDLASKTILHRVPYAEPLDAILGGDMEALPLAEYREVDRRLIPAEKEYSLTYRGQAFQERHFRIQSRHDIGTFYSTPGTVFSTSLKRR